MGRSEIAGIANKFANGFFAGETFIAASIALGVLAGSAAVASERSMVEGHTASAETFALLAGEQATLAGVLGFEGYKRQQNMEVLQFMTQPEVESAETVPQELTAGTPKVLEAPPFMQLL